MSQNLPENGYAQSHIYFSSLFGTSFISLHVPPFRHGFGLHGFGFVSVNEILVTHIYSALSITFKCIKMNQYYMNTNVSI